MVLHKLFRFILTCGLLLLTAACSLESASQIESDANALNTENAITATATIIEVEATIPFSPTVTAISNVDNSQTSSVQVQNQVSCNPRTDWKTYYVVAGDTLANLANLTGTSVDNIVQGNCLTDADVIQVGQALYLPTLPPTSSAPSSDSEQGYIVASQFVRINDGGNYVFENGSMATFTWVDADLSGLTEVEFIFRSYATGAQTSLGIDQNLADGATIQWQVSATTIGGGGTVIASGRYPGQAHEGTFSAGVGINVSP